ncbi:MAG: asparagine synthase-related protein [Woeseiaceae bacterium]
MASSLPCTRPLTPSSLKTLQTNCSEATQRRRLHTALPQFRAGALRDLVEGEEILHSISILELTNFIGERLLRDTDAASMAVSLEVRVPLLDHEVVEASPVLIRGAASIPSKVKGCFEILRFLV